MCASALGIKLPPESIIGIANLLDFSSASSRAIPRDTALSGCHWSAWRIRCTKAEPSRQHPSGSKGVTPSSSLGTTAAAAERGAAAVAAPAGMRFVPECLNAAWICSSRLVSAWARSCSACRRSVSSNFSSSETLREPHCQSIHHLCPHFLHDQACLFGWEFRPRLCMLQ